MLRFVAQWWAKRKYILSQETEAATNDLNAGLALKLAAEKRALIEKLNKEADEIDANIKSMDEKLDNGFWECENGHEKGMCMCALPGVIPIIHVSGCSRDPVNGSCECGKPMKLVKRDFMTGQEKYESDKERKEAEKIAADKRAQATAEEGNLAESERTAKYFKGLAQNGRALSQKIKSL